MVATTPPNFVARHTLADAYLTIILAACDAVHHSAVELTVNEVSIVATLEPCCAILMERPPAMLPQTVLLVASNGSVTFFLSSSVVFVDANVPPGIALVIV